MAKKIKKRLTARTTEIIAMTWLINARSRYRLMKKAINPERKVNPQKAIAQLFEGAFSVQLNAENVNKITVKASEPANQSIVVGSIPFLN